MLYNSFRPGQVRLDTEGKRIQACDKTDMLCVACRFCCIMNRICGRVIYKKIIK